MSADDQEDASPPLTPGLYLLATPIGAAMDLTYRGRDALARATHLACEDTRVLRRLMSLHGVPLGGRPMIAYHDHNADAARPRLAAALEGGASVLYASDAGTPLVADPGYRLVAAAHELGVPVRALPGPSALLAALVVSGLPTDRFAFGGFSPSRSAARRKMLEGWRDTPGTLVFFESPHRLAASLADMRAVFGDRPAAIARELTKTFEEVLRGDLGELQAQVEAGAAAKGEIVVLIGPAAAGAQAADPAEIEALLAVELEAKSLKDAVRTVSEHLATPRKVVYAKALEMTRRRDE